MVPYLDLYTGGYANGNMHYPGDVHAPLAACWSGGSPMAGEPIPVDGMYVYVGLEGDGEPEEVVYWYGHPYESAVTPNSPVMRGQDGQAVYASGVYWQNLRAYTADTGEFYVSVTDRDGGDWGDLMSPISWASEAAAPGKSQVIRSGFVDIPLQGEADALSVRLSTSGTREMCFPRMDYSIKVERQRRRV